jgi:hypothetical protein
MTNDTSTPKTVGTPPVLARAVQFYARTTRKPGWDIINEKYEVSYIEYLISGAGLTTVEDAIGFFQDVADEEPESSVTVTSRVAPFIPAPCTTTASA